jgi:hypothetical protein
MEVIGQIPHPRNPAEYVDMKVYFRVNLQARIVIAELIN